MQVVFLALLQLANINLVLLVDVAATEASLSILPLCHGKRYELIGNGSWTQNYDSVGSSSATVICCLTVSSTLSVSLVNNGITFCGTDDFLKNLAYASIPGAPRVA